MITLSERQIQLWLAFRDEISDPGLLESYRLLMSEAERARELRFQFDQDRTEYRIARALVRNVLSRYAPVEPGAWQFGANQYGKPEVLNDEVAGIGLQFNLAHSHGLIVLAVSKRRAIGVDVENVGRRRISLDIADRYFAPAEVAELASVAADRRRDSFFRYWTLKESYIKARGMGLSIPLDKFSFHFSAPQTIDIRIDADLADDPGRWDFWQFRPSADYMVAVCAERRAGPPPMLEVMRVVPARMEQTLHPTFL